MIAPLVQKPEYEPAPISAPVNTSAVYQANTPVPAFVKGVHLIVIKPLASLVALTLLGGLPVAPGEIDLDALGAPAPALLLAMTST